MKHLALTLLVVAMVGCQDPQQGAKPEIMNPKLESVIKITSEQLGMPADQIKTSATFASLGADDLDFVEIVMAAEDAHKVSIPDDLLTRIAGVSAAQEVVHHMTVAEFSLALDAAEQQTEKKTEGEVPTGTYAELVLQPLPQGHSYLFIPSLAAILKNREDKKGDALTHAEVIDIRDRAPAMIVPSEVIRKMEESRQYQDIDPTRPWDEWRRLRTHFDQ